MMLLTCPYCGPRGVSEFRYRGEAKTRPDPSTTTPVQWREYLYMERNPCGWVTENWYHQMGCRRYFTVERDTEHNTVRPRSEVS